MAGTPSVAHRREQLTWAAASVSTLVPKLSLQPVLPMGWQRDLTQNAPPVCFSTLHSNCQGVKERGDGMTKGRSVCLLAKTIETPAVWEEERILISPCFMQEPGSSLPWTSASQGKT